MSDTTQMTYSILLLDGTGFRNGVSADYGIRLFPSEELAYEWCFNLLIAAGHIETINGRLTLTDLHGETIRQEYDDEQVVPFLVERFQDSMDRLDYLHVFPLLDPNRLNHGKFKEPIE